MGCARLAHCCLCPTQAQAAVPRNVWGSQPLITGAALACRHPAVCRARSIARSTQVGPSLWTCRRKRALSATWYCLVAVGASERSFSRPPSPSARMRHHMGGRQGCLAQPSTAIAQGACMPRHAPPIQTRLHGTVGKPFQIPVAPLS